MTTVRHKTVYNKQMCKKVSNLYLIKSHHHFVPEQLTEEASLLHDVLHVNFGLKVTQNQTKKNLTVQFARVYSSGFPD